MNLHPDAERVVQELFDLYAVEGAMTLRCRERMHHVISRALWEAEERGRCTCDEGSEP